MHVQLGCERLLASSSLDGKRVGVVCNPASVDSQLRHVADLFARHPKARLAAIFGPQHGFRSDVQDNMIETRHARDEVRRGPGYLLFSENPGPTPPRLRALHVPVFYLPGGRGRVFSYIYTIANSPQAA